MSGVTQNNNFCNFGLINENVSMIFTCYVACVSLSVSMDVWSVWKAKWAVRTEIWILRLIQIGAMDFLQFVLKVTDAWLNLGFIAH